MRNTTPKHTPTDLQYDVWRKMPAAKAIKAVSDCSMFCLRLTKLNQQHGLRNPHYQNRKNTQ